MIKKITLFVFSFFFGYSLFSQSEWSFPVDSLERLLLKGMNNMRRELGYDTLESNSILKNASELQADHMTKSGKAETYCEKRKYRTTEKRLTTLGGSQNAEEIVAGISISKGKDYISAKEAAATLLHKWKDSKKDRAIITNGRYVLYGLTAKPEKKGKTIYISTLLSGYDITNDGMKKRSEIKPSYTSKNKKLQPFTPQGCKSCNKFTDYDSLRNGLYVNRDGDVYLKYYDLKTLKKLFKRSGDGLAVDIVQRAQYENPEYNIYNTRLFSRGILLKFVSGDKLMKNNIAQFNVKSKGKKNKKEETLNTKIGKFPKNIKGEYEMNLIIIQDGQVCKIIRPAYIETGIQKGVQCEMLLMPDSAAYLKPMFEPKAEGSLLTFKVPFEKNKSEYKEDDLKPLLDSLQEPEFTIDGIYIKAYSSIEGDSVSNALLQKNRAKSIIDALSKDRKAEIPTSITTSDSWLLFTMEMEDGQYDYLAKMTKHKAIHEINTKPGLAEELEPILAKERFAQIILDVTYDVKGDNEERFCVAKFNSAAKHGDIKQAEKIQYYIEKNISNKRFKEDVLSKLIIPQQPALSGLMMNQIVYNYFRNNRTVTEEDKTNLKELVKLDSKNTYVKYNYLFSKIHTEPTTDNAKITELQSEIDDLYKDLSFPKRYVDGLNTEFQFSIMDALDTLEGSEVQIQHCINKIKSYYDFKKASWQNSLKLAYSFIKHKEFNYSANLLEPFIDNTNVNEDILFTYISACSNVPERIVSKPFAEALRKAHKINPDRYCKLFGFPNLSFQVFEIPQIKEDYLKFKCN